MLFIISPAHLLAFNQDCFDALTLTQIEGSLKEDVDPNLETSLERLYTIPLLAVGIMPIEYGMLGLKAIEQANHPHNKYYNGGVVEIDPNNESLVKFYQLMLDHGAAPNPPWLNANLLELAQESGQTKIVACCISAMAYATANTHSSLFTG